MVGSVHGGGGGDGGSLGGEGGGGEEAMAAEGEVVELEEANGGGRGAPIAPYPLLPQTSTVMFGGGMGPQPPRRNHRCLETPVAVPTCLEKRIRSF